MAEQADQDLSRMLDVIQSMNATLDPDELFPMAIARVVEMFQAERGFLILGPDPESLRFQTAVSRDGQPLPEPKSQVSRAVIKRTAETREAVVTQNALTDSRFDGAASVRTLGLCSVLCAPLIADGELLGVVYLDNREQSGVFGEQDRDVLMVFAGQAAVAIRNAQLFAELKRARRRLLQAERLRAVGQLAASIAHEVRTPIAALKLMAGAARNQLDDPQFRAQFLETLQDESQRIDDIVSGLLTYAKPTKLMLCEMELPPVLDAAAGLCQGFADKAGASIRKHYAPGLPEVVADGEQLKQVFANLIQNAAAAVTESDEKTIAISATPRGDPHVVVQVTDTGHGMDEETRSKIFTPFFTTKQDGVGLGLAITAKIVAEHGGTIEATSEVGQGTTFSVSLPLAGPAGALPG